MKVHPVKYWPPYPVVDFHVHLFPDRLFDAIWKTFENGYGHKIEYQLYTPQIIRFLRERGVEKIVYSNYAHKKGVAAYLNEWNLKLLKQETDLFCFAAIHPEDDAYINDVRKLLRHPRILGFKLQLLVQRIYPHDERLYPLYEATIEAGKRILMHVGTGPIGNEFVGYDHFQKLLNKYPELKVNVPHMGELEVTPFLDILEQYPDIYLDTAYAFFDNPFRPYQATADDLLLHQDRILYGSDFPNVIFKREDEIEALLGYDLGDAFYRKIFFENAEKLLPEL